MELIIKTQAGLEPILAKELEEFGAENIELQKRAVSCIANKELLYTFNLHLRTALRVLVPIRRFDAKTEEQLYNRIKKIDWSKYISLKDTFAIDALTNSPKLNHSKYIAYKTKDAIVDQFREASGRRPNINTISPTLRINVHINAMNNVTVSLDSSGDSLHKRSYRIQSVMAPVNEVLAAGMIMLSDWDRKKPFVDPMCGSGTIAIEAAFMATNTPPNILRENFGFMNWKNYDKEIWDNILKKAKAGIIAAPGPILAADKDFKAIGVTRHNVSAAGMDEVIEIKRSKFEKLNPGYEEGTLIMNPPYDERMEEEDTVAFYQEIGDSFKKHFTGFSAYIISSNIEALKLIGLKASEKHHLFNGALECQYRKYEMYSGSKE